MRQFKRHAIGVGPDDLISFAQGGDTLGQWFAAQSACAARALSVAATAASRGSTSRVI